MGKIRKLKGAIVCWAPTRSTAIERVLCHKCSQNYEYCPKNELDSNQKKFLIATRCTLFKKQKRPIKI